jgi:hypothetical protein
LNKKVDAFKLRAEAMKHHISIVPEKFFHQGAIIPISSVSVLANPGAMMWIMD